MSGISELKFDDKNFNKHTQYGMSLLEKSLRENGAGRSILIDKDNNIIAGNGVVEAAGSIGMDKVKIVEVKGDELVAVKRTDISLNSRKGREMALADNATAAEDLSWDNDTISEVSEQFGFDPGDWLSSWDKQIEDIEEDEAPEVDESEPPKSELGKIYQLGEHRLMCGDSTDAGSVAILMDGQKADMVFTDPPYNVNYSGRGEDNKLAPIKNDNMGDEDCIEELKDGPHKRDMIRHYKRKIREEPNSKRWGDNFKIYNGDCLEKLDELAENSIDCIVTDPPYELNFMGKGWDNAGISFQTSTWAKCLRVLKPGGYLLAFGGTRTYHRIACAIEDAGFEIRDCIMWLYGSGFPKSMNIGLAVDKRLGVPSKIIGKSENVRPNSAPFNSTFVIKTKPDGFFVKEAQNEWKGWGTCLKPAYEPIIVARKPFKGSLVDNVMKYGVGGLNIDECRVEMADEKDAKNYHFNNNGNNRLKKNEGEKLGAYDGGWKVQKGERENPTGRFPANTILTYNETDFDEVCGGFPNTAPTKPHNGDGKKLDTREMGWGFRRMPCSIEDNGGSAARYFYCAKASKKDRDEGLEEFVKDITDDGRDKPIDNPYLRGKTLRHNTHPTVKPTNLMQYLVRLVAPMGATILDPFMGSGSTGKAVMFENKERQAGYKFIGIEKDPEYCKIAEARINCAKGGQWQMSRT